MLDQISGFDPDSLLDSLTEQIEIGVDKLASQAGDFAKLARNIPFIGTQLSTELTDVIMSGLRYEDEVGQVQAYLEDRGFQVQRPTITPREIIDSVLDGSISDKDLFMVRFLHEEKPTNEIRFAADGHTDFNTGPVDVDLCFGGDVTAEPTINIDVTFGLNTAHGPFVVEGGGIAADLPVAGTLMGSLSAGKLFDLTAKADARFDANASLTFDDGLPGDRIYIFNSSVADIINIPTNVQLTGTVSLDMSVSVPDPLNSLPDAIGAAVRDFLPNLSWTAMATYNLADGTGRYDVMEFPSFESIEQAVFRKMAERLDQFNPLPQNLRDLLTKRIGFLGNNTLLELAGLGTEAEFFVNPRSKQSSDDVGPDTVSGGAGKDTLVGAGGNDTIEGDGDDDTIQGGNGDDVLRGGEGADLIDEANASGPGDRSGEMNALEGGLGNDSLIGSPGADRIVGDEGKDVISGGEGSDLLIGGLELEPTTWNPAQQNDYIDAGPGEDTAYGGSGEDYLIGGLGSDLIDGGTDADYLVLRQA